MKDAPLGEKTSPVSEKTSPVNEKASAAGKPGFPLTKGTHRRELESN
jgi:hypothetical protein